MMKKVSKSLLDFSSNHEVRCKIGNTFKQHTFEHLLIALQTYVYYPLNPNLLITSGLDTFTSAATELVLGADSPAIKENRVS